MRQRARWWGEVKELFLEFAKKGAMTPEELAAILRRKPNWVRDNSRGSNPLIPRLPGKPIRFDPMVMIEVFCRPLVADQKPRSLTIERHKTGEKPIGGYRKCL